MKTKNSPIPGFFYAPVKLTSLRMEFLVFLYFCIGLLNANLHLQINFNSTLPSSFLIFSKSFFFPLILSLIRFPSNLLSVITPIL